MAKAKPSRFDYDFGFRKKIPTILVRSEFEHDVNRDGSTLCITIARNESLQNPPRNCQFSPSLARYGASIDVKSKTVALTSDTDKNWKAAYTFERPGTDQLILDGGVDGHRTHLQERNDFLVELFVNADSALIHSR